MYFLLLVFSVLILSNVAKSSNIEDFPYAVVINGLQYQTCGGSIISEHWILTTLGCVSYPYPPEYYKVQAGTRKIKGGDGSVHQVDKIIAHEMFRLDSEGPSLNDIALIHVVEPFVETPRKEKSSEIWGPD